MSNTLASRPLTHQVDRRALTESEAAAYIGMSRSFLRQDRMNGLRECRTPGPRFIRIGRSIRYLREDLDFWLDQWNRLGRGRSSE